VQDIETFDLEDFKYNFVNMTAFRIVDAEDVGVREILKDMERFQPAGRSILNKPRVIQVGYCYCYCYWLICFEDDIL
jgi:ionotropic kainate glutamate receptor 2